MHQRTTTSQLSNIVLFEFLYAIFHAMSYYRYSPLPPGSDSIRLLRLMPHKDETAPIQCELFEYSLQESSKGIHLYEALSYVWGDLDKPPTISINKRNLAVTENLYKALSRLRDCCLERILWVDAICIDQKNLEERGQQVRLMAKIYSKAARVLVWLGETADDSDAALEHICLAANEESTERSKEEMSQRVIKLLQRPWFQRIWVLQEVAAARHIVIKCGSMEIDGYAFCLGLKSLELSYTASPELQTLPSVIYLIERTGLRSKYTTYSSERFSLKIRRLAELIDMFHTRKASDVRDKVYALLGMSSDDPGEAGLRPDYDISWKELFQQLVKFILYKDVSVEIPDNSNDSQRAVIKSKGCVLGRVSLVRSDERQNVNITFTPKNIAWHLGDKIEWTLQASAKSIQEGDIVCLLQGVSEATIIRQCKDHFAVVVITAIPLNKSGSFGLSEPLKRIARFPRDFLLVWDWEQPLGEPQDQEESKNWVSLDKATRTWNVALILRDLQEHEKAEKRLREAIKGYEIAFGEEHPHMLKSQYGLTPLSWATGNGYYVIANILLAKDSIDLDLKDSQYDQTPLSWAAEKGHEAVVKLLLETGKVDVDASYLYGRTPLSLAAEGGHEAVVKLLLETSKVNVDSKDSRYGQTPLSLAAERGHEAVVKLLLETGKVDVDSKDKDSWTPLRWAAMRGHEAVVKLLLETGNVDVDSKNKYENKTPLSLAAAAGHEAVVKLLLLETGKVDVDSKDNRSRTPLWWAAMRGHEAVVKLLKTNT